MNNAEKQNKIRTELNAAINELSEAGLDLTTDENTEGLGDLVEGLFTKIGITEDRIKEWTGLSECGCSKRKKWLNKMLSWRKK